MAIDVYLRLDDLPLFKKPRKHERLSQYQRACEVRDAFAHCMTNALQGVYCCMPEMCALGDKVLSCNHLHVDYSNFTGSGIPLTGRARTLIDARLRAVGTLVYRGQNLQNIGSLPGDIHLPALARIASFPAPRKARAPAGAPRKQPPTGKSGGFFGRLFGF